MNNKELFDFIKKAPTAFHTVDVLEKNFAENGYQKLQEMDAWKLEKGGKYYVSRNGSSCIAFAVPEKLEHYHFQVTAAHSDSPAFKVKENAEISVKGKYLQLNTEGYGGMLCSTWFDRPLSLAGRLLIKEKDGLSTKLFHADRDVLMIPSVAIHMNRKANEEMKYNKQVDLLPLFAMDGQEENAYRKFVAEELSGAVAVEDIVGMDVYLYNRSKPAVFGRNNEFIGAPRLDDLQCAFAGMKAMLAAKAESHINVYACFDNEEVGSGTKQGAASTFLRDVLRRINQGLGYGKEEYYRAIAGSFMVSCDNAHAVHPNHPEKTDATNCVYLNEGVVIKSHAGQKYTSDAVSMAVFGEICKKAGVPVQYFANRSDELGGSTLGNIAMSQVSMNCVDVGCPQLAMHSAYETAGAKDTEYMVLALTKFYECNVLKTEDTTYRIG